MTVQRYFPAHVVPLELWDVLVDSTPLYLVPDAQQPQAIRNVVLGLRAGTACRLRAGHALPRLTIERVVVAGGGPVRAVVAELERAGLHTASSPDPVFIAEPGGRALLSQLWHTGAFAVMDVGQTSIKYSDAQGRVRITRKLSDIPLECDARALPQAEMRERCVQFFGSVARARVRPDALVLALPCEVAANLTVAGCSYPWPAGDTHLVHDILQAADCTGVPTLVLNDAELAAVSVDCSRDRTHSTLVLTVGRGLGGAYLPARWNESPR